MNNGPEKDWSYNILGSIAACSVSGSLITVKLL